MARRAGVALTLEELDAIARRVPVCANLFPTGRFLMEDFFFAGGLLAQLAKLRPWLHLECLTVTGRTLGEELAAAQCYDHDVIRDPANAVVPLEQGVTLALLRGSLCPDGAVMKTCSADPRLLRHTGRALVFDSCEELYARIDDPQLEVDRDSVLVLRNAGPVGAPGMPEWGNLPIPKKLLAAGVRDMVRVCDGRMSGTHYGTCVLHVAPEAAIGGPLALVRNGDLIALDAPAGRLDVLLDEHELAQRRAQWRPAVRRYPRSYAALYQAHVLQANEGCDFDFLSGNQPLAEPEIY
jgi:dihydroxyacid dehydratase/phosphogluconate dehydratase